MGSDHATSEICSAFFVPEEGTMSTFQRIQVEAKVLFALRRSGVAHTPEAGGKVDKDKLTQVGRALRIELIPAYSPEGRSERMFGTLQKRLPQELRTQGIETMDEANLFLKDVFLPDHNTRFMCKPEGIYSPLVGF